MLKRFKLRNTGAPNAREQQKKPVSKREQRNRNEGEERIWFEFLKTF